MNVNSKKSFTSTTPSSECVVSQQNIRAGALTVKHQISPPAEFSLPEIKHHTMVIHLETDSTRQVTQFGGREYDGVYESGDFWLAAEDTTPGFWSWNGTSETMMFIVEPLYLKEIAAESNIASPERIELRNIVSGADSQLELLAKQYRTEMQQGSVGGQLFSESLGNLLVVHLLRHYTCQKVKLRQYDSGLGRNSLKRVLSYIEENLEESFGLDDLAAVTRFSKCHFMSLFKQSVGISPYRYVLLQRIERAKHLLSQDNLSINEIAVQCGFSDQSHMGKHFQKMVKMTPRAFRQR